MTIPNEMKCIEISRPGGPEVLSLASRPIPQVLKNEVLIKVSAAGINRPDCLQRKGVYPPPAGVTDIPGLEVSGQIIALGEQVQDQQLGDFVTALVSGEGYSEFAVAPSTQCLPIPNNLNLIESIENQKDPGINTLFVA